MDASGVVEEWWDRIQARDSGAADLVTEDIVVGWRGV